MEAAYLGLDAASFRNRKILLCPILFSILVRPARAVRRPETMGPEPIGAGRVRRAANRAGFLPPL